MHNAVCLIGVVAIIVSTVAVEAAASNKLVHGHIADWPQNVNSFQFASREAQEEVGPLRKKANEYDVWNAKYHHPFHGGLVSVTFKDKERTEIADYGGTGDSSIWTGTYLGSQALRYGATKDPEARKNIRRNVEALDGYLHVTNKTGYIARYWGMQNSSTYKGDKWCKDKDSCRKVTSGKYAGDYWEGLTTKDQYSGWFFGMGLAYDFTDDIDLREMIKKDLLEVVDQLIRDEWIIVNDLGKYNVISAGPRPTYIYQLSWLTTAYHVSGLERYKAEIEKRLSWFEFFMLELSSYSSFANRYTQYYGNNLAHTTWYGLLRLARAYYPQEDHERLRGVFIKCYHSRVRLTHNPWFNAIYMSQGGEYEASKNDPYQTQLLEDLREFRPCPNVRYHLPTRPRSSYKLDIATSWVKYFPFLRLQLAYIKLPLLPQAEEAFPISQQCSSDFMFQRSPYVIDHCGYDDQRVVAPGNDYLVSYWLACYHGLIKKSQ